jgi:hypothetical protein
MVTERAKLESLQTSLGMSGHYIAEWCEARGLTSRCVMDALERADFDKCAIMAAMTGEPGNELERTLFAA